LNWREPILNQGRNGNTEATEKRQKAHDDLPRLKNYLEGLTTGSALKIRERRALQHKVYSRVFSHRAGLRKEDPLP
jgi:hypothetical protein